MAEVTIERLATADFIANGEAKSYIDIHGLHALYDKMAFRAHVILVGPKGTGKSLSVAAWASAQKHPLITFDCSEDVRRSHLLGHCMIRGDQTPFILGPLTTAFEVANEHGACVLNLEEVNALTPQCQKVLNAIADWRCKLEVPEAGKVFKLRQGARLWITASMNPTVYGGVHDLNEDLKSRFRMLALDYPASQEEFKILQAQATGVDDRVLKSLCALAHETRQKALEYPLSTRDLVQIAEDAAMMDLQTALRIALGKFEGEDKATVKARMSAGFANVRL